MKTNVELEFINKVRELSEATRNLAIFWYKNRKELESLDISKDHPFSESLQDLALEANNWYVVLSNEYYEKMLKNKH
jgi:hypothetical protein